MGTARPSVTKRQREQIKRERQLRKLEKRAERKNAPAEEAGDEPVVMEVPEAAEIDSSTPAQ
jgi:hypothetical protein